MVGQTGARGFGPQFGNSLRVTFTKSTVNRARMKRGIALRRQTPAHGGVLASPAPCQPQDCRYWRQLPRAAVACSGGSGRGTAEGRARTAADARLSAAIHISGDWGGVSRSVGGANATDLRAGRPVPPRRQDRDLESSQTTGTPARVYRHTDKAQAPSG